MQAIMNTRKGFRALALAGVVALAASASSGCSVRKLAVNKLGNALAGSGASFASDDDPDLVKAAVPFSLKLMESLLAESPRHDGLLFASASGFAQYAYAFVQQDADELEATDFAAAERMRDRARRLFLRARDYGLRALEGRHRSFRTALQRDPATALGATRKRDVPLLYWTAVSWGAAIALSKDDPYRVAEVPQMEALIDRALALDPSWDHGAIHSFLITYEMSRAGLRGDPAERSRAHFDRAVELSEGRTAGPYVALAEAVAAQNQDLAAFDRLLGQALAIDADAHPESRLVNLIMQRRARWLLSRRGDLFLIPEPMANP
jgi:predicted anti-sigma-YlaC factor YlaD